MGRIPTTKRMRPIQHAGRLASARTPLHESDAMSKIKSLRPRSATPPLGPIRSSSAPIKCVRAIDHAPSPAGELDESLIANVEAYIDTVEITYPRRPKGLLAEARAILGRKVWFEDVIDAKGNRWFSRLIVHQPNERLLLALDKYGGSVTRVDLAFDFFPIDMSVELLAQVIRANTFLRWRRAQPMHEYETTLYWAQQHREKARPDRNLAEYHDLPSKLTGSPVSHLELRLQTSDATKAEGFDRPSALGKLNPRAIFDKHIRIVHFERHRLNTIDGDKRTRAHFQRAYQDRVQLFKDRQPHLIKLLEPLNGRFAVKDRLTWGAVSGPKDAFTWLTRDQKHQHSSQSDHPSSALIMQPTNPEVSP